MKVLLTTLNSKYVHSNLALKYLYMAGKGCSSSLDLREFTINNSRDYIFTELVMGDYDAVGFSCYIWNIDKILELAADLKKAKPQVYILLGGPEVSYDARQFMEEHDFVDFLIAGQGEIAFGCWCRAIEGELSYEEVPGLCCRRAGKIFENPQKQIVFQDIPFPYQEFACEKDKVIYYEASRGCPFGCTYCISSLDRELRELPVSRVQADLSHFIRTGVKQVKFLDRTFNWNKERTMELLGWIIKSDQGTTSFHLEICGDLLDEELLDLLKNARQGLFEFEIGIQSVNEKTLRAVNRFSSVEKTLSNVKALTDMGNSHVHVDLIAGLPFEDYQSFRNSFNQVYALMAHHLQLGFLKMLKGTEIRKQAERYAYTYMEKAPYQVISNEFMCARDLCRLGQIEEVLELYYNRGGFEGSLSWAIERMEGTAFDFYECFTDYYYAHGYQNCSHKKEDLYRIFYGFGQSMGQGEELLPLLLADLENTMNFDAVKKFKRKGWSIQQVHI